jgi:O-acetyl-ADP-ribose deacetylase (regulator of RNase III)
VNGTNVKLSNYINCNANVNDITKLKFSKNTAFVSAANGEGYLGGGVDAALRSMFPKVQPLIREAVIENGYLNGRDEQFIPVGSATIVPINQTNKLNQFLITSPTMLSPSNVSTTDNCYYALYATLRLVKKFNESLKKEDKPLIENIFCPGLGTGVGGMPSKNAAQQFVKAIVDFILFDLACIMVPSKEHEIYVTDISTHANSFIRAPREFIISQPDWKRFMRKYKPGLWESIHYNKSTMSDATLATIMNGMSDADLASNFASEPTEQSDDSDDEEMDNFVLRPSKGTQYKQYRTESTTSNVSTASNDSTDSKSESEM